MFRGKCCDDWSQWSTWYHRTKYSAQLWSNKASHFSWRIQLVLYTSVFFFCIFFERIFDTVLSWYKLFQVSEGSSFRTSRKFWFYCWYVGNLILSKNFFCSPQLIERRFFTAITDTFLFYSFFGKHDCVSTGAELLHYVEVYDALITTLCRLSNDKTILFFCYQKRRPQEEIKFFQKLIHFFEIYLVSVKSSLFYTRIFFLTGIIIALSIWFIFYCSRLFRLLTNTCIQIFKTVI